MSWYKDSFFWRKPSPQWEIDNYKFAPNGLGDLIFNTCVRNLEEPIDNEDDWFVRSWIACRALLNEKKRWPNEMHNLLCSENWFRWRWSQLLQRLKIQDTVLYRPQKNMTRDGYIAWFSLSAQCNMYYYSLKIPWYLYTPSVFSWRKYLITHNRIHLFIYRLFTKIPTKKDYVIRLRELMKQSIKT